MNGVDSAAKVKKRVGIMGGTFDPIHYGHLELAKQAHLQYGLKEVMFMPAINPPHKSDELIAHVDDRCNMVKLAIEPYPYFTFSDYEIKRGGVSYSYITLTHFSQIYDDIYFIIGADSLLSIEKWYHPEIVMSKCTLLAANRDNHRIDELQQCIDMLSNKYNARIELLHMQDIPISSTDIRQAVQCGESISQLVPLAVKDYIAVNHLY